MIKFEIEDIHEKLPGKCIFSSCRFALLSLFREPQIKLTRIYYNIAPAYVLKKRREGVDWIQVIYAKLIIQREHHILLHLHFGLSAVKF
jgi:hypothetical protein